MSSLLYHIQSLRQSKHKFYFYSIEQHVSAWTRPSSGFAKSFKNTLRYKCRCSCVINKNCLKCENSKESCRQISRSNFRTTVGNFNQFLRIVQLLVHFCLNVFFGAFAKLRKSDSQLLHVCPFLSAWKNLASTGLIFMRLDIGAIFEHLLRKLKFN